MAKIELIKPKKSRHEITQEWLDNCALEGIFPSTQALKEMELFNSSDLTSEEFRAHLIKKYTQKSA